MKQLIVTGIAVIVAIVVLSLIAGGLDDQRDEIQTGWSWMLRLIGSVFIIAPAVVLVMIAIRGEGLGGALPWIVALLAGVVLMSQSWGTCVGLAGVAIAKIMKGQADAPAPA